GAATEIDLDGAEEAYRRALELAEKSEEERTLAARRRDVAMIDFGRVRSWFGSEIMSGRGNEMLAAVAAGIELETLLVDAPIAPQLAEATRFLDRARGTLETLRAY